MFGLLKKIFGTKQDKDVQAFQARVIEINQYFDQYNSLSNDQLRNKTIEFKERIKEYLSNIDQEINDLKDRAASIEDIHEKKSLQQSKIGIYQFQSPILIYKEIGRFIQILGQLQVVKLYGICYTMILS